MRGSDTHLNAAPGPRLLEKLDSAHSAPRHRLGSTLCRSGRTGLSSLSRRAPLPRDAPERRPVGGTEAVAERKKDRESCQKPIGDHQKQPKMQPCRRATRTHIRNTLSHTTTIVRDLAEAWAEAEALEGGEHHHAVLALQLVNLEKHGEQVSSRRSRVYTILFDTV